MLEGTYRSSTQQRRESDFEASFRYLPMGACQYYQLRLTQAFSEMSRAGVEMQNGFYINRCQLTSMKQQK